MKYLRVIVILGIFFVSMLALQFKVVEATSPMQIVSSSSSDPWGNVGNNIYRGYPASVDLSLDSSVSGTYQVYVTLVDTNNIPVGFATTGNIQLNGKNNLMLNLNVASYAFVGLGKYVIVVVDQNSQPVSSLNKPVSIRILGDFNLDGSVNFQDLTNFVTAYTYYNQYYTIPSNYKCSDINGDGKIDFVDLTIFATAYVSYWNN